MTDEQISEIYSLGRESFFGGQRVFQVQAYPFRMTPTNLAKHRNNPNMPFWKMLKEGNDHFEVSRQEPKVDVCDRRYVFDAQAPAGASRAPNFNPTGACPAYQIPEELASAVRDKQREDEVKAAELATRGTPVARMNTGIDGGMNAVFAAKVPNGQTGLSDTNSNFSVASYSAAPGTIPPTVNPPRALEPQPTEPFVGAPPQEATAAAAPQAAPAASSDGAVSGNFFHSLARKVGMSNDTTATTAPPQVAAQPPKPAAKSPAVARPASVVASKPAAPAPAKDIRTADAKPAPAPAARPVASAQAQPKPTTTASNAPADQPMAGAQPIVSTNSFENRWTNFR
jgi:hypothetical protein